MKNIIIAFRSLFKKGRHNIMKIVSLGVGLAVGLVLIAKVYFEQSYDSFYPEADRIYQIWESVERDGELKDWGRTSGGTAGLMKENIPEIEMATRINPYGTWTFTMTDTKLKYKGKVIFGDSCLFDMLPRPVLAGNAKEVLSTPMQVMISSRMAKNIGGNVVGKTFTPDDAPERQLTISGVYEEIPENASDSYDVIISMPSSPRFMRANSHTNLFGNDRYISYIKLYPNTSLKSVSEGIQQVVNKYFPPEEQEKAGFKFSYTLHRLPDIHKEDPQVKRMTWLLSLLALALIGTAMMNYILIVVSSIVNRSKEIAVHKCYGAGGRNIHGMMLGEAFVHIILSLLLATVLILVFRGTVEELLDASLEALLLSKGSLILLLVCAFVFLGTGLMPGYLYTRIPVASAFRNFRESKRIWKLALLFVQFIAAGFLFTMLAFIGRQYTYMVNDNPGYSYDNLAYCEMVGIDSTARSKAIYELMRRPEVAAVTTFTQVPFWGFSGNNVYLPGTDKELFNIADHYWVGNDYLKIMEIPVIQGRSFTENVTNSDEVMVDSRFVEKMKLVAGWTDDVIGKSICVTEHCGDDMKAHTICGVFENIRLGSIDAQDERPSVLFYDNIPSRLLLVKFHRLDADGMAEVQKTISSLFPDRDLVLNAYRTELTNIYADSRQFRDSVMIGGCITLLIALIGLIGYTNDEVNRRRKEIAIRRVSGSTLMEIMKMFLKDIICIALPAIVLGGCLAFFAVQKWMEQFSEKVPLSWYIFIGCGAVVMLIILAVVSLDVRHTANDNPVNSLKSE